LHQKQQQKMKQTNKNSHETGILATLLFLMVSIFTHDASAQEGDSTKTINHFGGAVTVTNNGISLLPTFSLGKPAVMFDMSAGNRKLSFEPQLPHLGSSILSQEMNLCWRT